MAGEVRRTGLWGRVMDRHAIALAAAAARVIRRANAENKDRVERMTVKRKGERVETTTRDHRRTETR